MTKIESIEVFVVERELARPYTTATHTISQVGTVLLKVRTDEGIIGLGEAHGSARLQIAATIQQDFAPLLLGQDALMTARHWQLMFDRGAGNLVSQRRSRAATMAAIGGLDIALWDIRAKVAGMPLWTLLGGYNSRIPAYATGGYGRGGSETLAELAHEFATVVERGFRRVKVKVGWSSTGHDVARMRTVREAVGPDVKVYMDASQAFDVPTAIDFGRRCEEFDISWFEEPVRWYDEIAGLAQVARQVRVPITSGEKELSKQGIRDLIRHGHISITNFDCTTAGGFTEGLKVAAIAEAGNVAFAPHHAAQLHAHLAAAIPNGHSVEMFTTADRDPLWDTLYRGRPTFADGELQLNDEPGLGYSYDDEVLSRFGTVFAG